MCIKVIHAVFQVSLALGTITELQIWIVLLGPSADLSLIHIYKPMLNLNLKKKETLFQNAETDTLSLFYVNGTGKLNKEFRFAKIDSHFGAFLPYLTDGAVKLYLHYAFAANSNTGESWHSMDTISRELGTTERSIGNWNRSLEDLGLIYRTRNKKKSKTTFILPLTGFAAVSYTHLPTAAVSTYCVTPTLEQWALWAVPNASFTYTSQREARSLLKASPFLVSSAL